MASKPGRIEAETLEVEEVAGVIPCIHREGEHEPGQGEETGEERRCEQCDRGCSSQPRCDDQQNFRSEV